MPYKSQKQMAYFNANRKELERQGVDVNEWNASTRGKKLPKEAMITHTDMLAAVLIHNLEKRAQDAIPARQPMPQMGETGTADWLARSSVAAHEKRMADQIASDKQRSTAAAKQQKEEADLFAFQNSPEGKSQTAAIMARFRSAGTAAKPAAPAAPAAPATTPATATSAPTPAVQATPAAPAAVSPMSSVAPIKPVTPKV